MGGGCYVALVSLGMGWGLEEKVMKEKWARDALDGPPIPWVPPLCFLSPIPWLSKYVPTHIPLERGGAGAAVIHILCIPGC